MTRADFMERIVFGWIKNDLERMKMTIRPISGKAGNINFPLALCSLSYMEYLGGYLLGNEGDFTKNASAYIAGCFDNPSEYSVDILRSIFRNGLVHAYFSCGGGISREGERPALKKMGNEEVILDVEVLVDDFIVSLLKFSGLLKEESYNKRTSQLIEKHKSEKMKLKNEINKLPPISGELKPAQNSAFFPKSLVSLANPSSPSETITTTTRGISGLNSTTLPFEG